MAIMNQRRETKKRPASLLPGDRTTQPAEMPSIMQPSMQPNNPLGDQAPTVRGSVQSGPAPASMAQTSATSPVPGQLPTTTTSERTHEIISKDSPLMRQAETRGRQYAHQRGLLNSSLAAGAAQGAVLDRGIELGKADIEDEFRSFYAGLDMTKFESDSNYRNRALDQEKEIQDRKLSLDEEISRGKLSLDEEISRGGLELEESRLGFDRQRFASDEGYRDRVLAQEKELTRNRLNFDVTRFRSDEEYRNNVLAQEKDLETRRLSLVAEENDFRRKFDKRRFESDSKYRGEVLAQEKKIAKKRSDLEIERLGIDKERDKQNAHQGLRNTLSQLYANYQATVASIMSVPGMTRANRQAALDKALADYDAARRDAGYLGGPSVPIDWGEGDQPPEGEGGYTPTPPTPTSPTSPTPTPDTRQQWQKDRDACVARGGRWNHTGRFCEETGDRSALQACRDAGGTWNPRTRSCDMPPTPTTPTGGKSALQACRDAGGTWNPRTRRCDMP